MLGSNWLIFSPMGGQEYNDISRYYVVKSRFLSGKNDFISCLNDMFFFLSVFLDLISILFFLL